VTRRRFWTSAEVTGEGPFGVALDGRRVKTPLKAPLDVPTRALAEAMAGEWQRQGEKIDPFSMPMTRLANTAIDRVRPERERIVDEIVRHAGADLVCYRAAEPADLVALQALSWDPVIDWAMRRLDAVFTVGPGVVHRAQAPASLERVRALLAARDEWALTALHNFATLSGSGLLAAMLADGAITPEQAWAAAHVDEDWQASQWGVDEEAAERRERRRGEFFDADRFMRLVREP
jgi:chaperone required for assembly of F1-ATPase